MDWANEDYVKVYTRDTDDDLMLSWQALALWRAMLLKFDRSGLLETRRGVRGLAALVRMPADVVGAALPELLEDGRLEAVPAGYFAPNFLAAQEASKSDRQRQRESRERRAASARRGEQLCKNGFIYACVAGSGEIKIGFASDVESRMASLRTARPDGLTLLGSWPGTTLEEAEALERFAHLRLAGEWFRDDGSIRSFVIQQTIASQVVTGGHDSSQPVTLTSADPLLPLLPDPEDSLSRAIPQSVPQPEPAPVPAASPPAPAREDIAGTHEADCPAETETGQNRPVRTSNEAEKPATPVGDRDVKPSNPILAAQAFDPNDAFARGRLAQATWRRISDAALALAAELKLPTPIPFPAITPGSNRKGFVELRERIREEGELAPTVCDRVVEHLVKQARSKRSIEWLAERVFGENAWVNARNGIDPSARPTVPRRGDPPPPAPARKRPDPEPRTPSRSAAELAELAAMADRLVANPDAAAAAELELGRVPAHLPTAELVKRFGDSARAPPASAFPDDTPDPNPRSRKARTA